MYDLKDTSSSIAQLSDHQRHLDVSVPIEVARILLITELKLRLTLSKYTSKLIMPHSIEELTLPALTIPTSGILYNKLLKISKY